MPEEINRLVTDQLADLLFTPSEDGNLNLQREGVACTKVHLVGNVMIDTLVRMLPKAAERIPTSLPDKYALVTLHRPSNVDDLPWLIEMLRALQAIGRELTVLFPVHPRTRQRLAEAGTNDQRCKQVQLLDPLPYIDFLALQTRAAVVITDSGGIQEETTYLGIPCLTVRENTERPITVDVGTNTLVGRDLERLRVEIERIQAGQQKKGAIPPLWDGHAAERIATAIQSGVWHH
jgi:UDP-N-acetylglucosamine 2-epimerase (non-hydrolysing)